MAGVGGVSLRQAAQECIEKAECAVTTPLGELRALYRRNCDRLAEGEQSLRKVEEAQCSNAGSVVPAELKQLWGLQQDPASLGDVAAVPNLESLAALQCRLAALKSGTTNEDRIRIFRTLIDTLRGKASDLEKHLAGEAQTDTTPLTEPCLASLDLLEEYMNEKRPHVETAPLAQDVANGISRVARVCEMVGEQEAKWASGALLLQRLQEEHDSPGVGAVPPGSSSAARAERFAAQPNAIERHRWLTEQYEDIFEYFGKVLRLLRDNAVVLQGLIDTNASYKGRAEVVKQASLASLDAHMEAVQGTTATCSSDIETVAAQVEACRAEGIASEQELREWKVGSDERLRLNIVQQDKCWERLFTVEKDLSRLGEERRNEIKDRVNRVVDDAARRLSLQRIVQCAEGYVACLHNQISNNTAALSVISYVRDTVVMGIDKSISAQRKSVKHQLTDMRVDVEKKELDLFRSLYIKIGDLVQRAQLYLEKLESGMASSWQIRTLYSTTRTELQEQIDTLRELQRDEAAAFAPTEASLRSEGVAFVHPCAEEETEAMKETRRAYARREKKSQQECEVARLEFTLSRETARPDAPDEMQEELFEAVSDGRGTTVLSTGSSAVARDLDRVVLEAPASTAATIAARRVLGGAPLSACMRADARPSPSPAPPTAPRPLNPSPPSNPRSSRRKSSGSVSPAPSAAPS